MPKQSQLLSKPLVSMPGVEISIGIGRKSATVVKINDRITVHYATNRKLLVCERECLKIEGEIYAGRIRAAETVWKWSGQSNYKEMV
jgi:hypothetical protein